MTELPFCLQPSKPSDNNDYESYKKGEFELEEWEDVNYCEHSFNHGDEGLTDREVVDLLYAQNKEIEQLKETIETQNFNYDNAKSIIHDSENQIRNLKDKNQQLKEEIKDLNDVLARYEEKELIE